MKLLLIIFFTTGLFSFSWAFSDQQSDPSHEPLQNRLYILQQQINTLEEILDTARKNNFTTFSMTTSAIKDVTIPHWWEKINGYSWIYYLTFSLAGLALLFLLISISMICFFRKKDKVMQTRVAAVFDPSYHAKRPLKNAHQQSALKNDVEPSEKTAIKLELAIAYYNLGDMNSAKGILEEIVQEGHSSELKTAEEWLAKINNP